MNFLDVETVMVGNLVCDVIILVFFVRLWQQNNGRYRGIGLWLADGVLQLTAGLLLALRGTLPDAVPVLLGNGMVIGGTILLFIGLERFVDRRSPLWPNALLLAGFLAIHAYFLFAVPSLNFRNLNLSLAFMLTCGQIAWLMLRRVGPDLKPIMRGIGYIMVAYCLVSLTRFAVDSLSPGSAGNNFLQSGLFDTLVILTYEMLLIALTFALFLAVNRRLITDLETDIRAKSGVEEALRSSEEKFSKAFHSSPDAVLITRTEDGRLLEVNEGFNRITGYSREEALASTTQELRLWANPKDRGEAIALLTRTGKLQEREYRFRAKNGRIFTGLYSSEIIHLAGESHIVSIVRDISEQKEIEAILQLRLHLWEYAASHSLAELLQETLDRIGEISNSPIGFFHYVEDDQQSLTLQTWSTRTLQEFCRAEGAGRHYAIDQAGIWADAIRTKKPVIQNQYATAPGRKGLPEGHAEVLRYLVIPILRHKLVVAAFGIGNKPTEYTRQDLEFVTNIADIAWTVVENKRSEERILQLQGQLRAMALHDPLTGLLNRYYLEETLKRELARGAREAYPVSFIMLDIDHFKSVNDTFGHKTGDAILQNLAVLLKKRSRGSDLLYRYGGEEFLAVLPKVTTEVALQISEKWRKNFQESTGVLGQTEGRVTLSCGIASFPIHGTQPQDLISKADQAMYKAKEAGRNRSIIWQKSTRQLHT